MNKHTAFPHLPLDGVRKFQNAARSVIDQGKETCGLQGMSPSGEKGLCPVTQAPVSYCMEEGRYGIFSSFPSPYIEEEGVCQGWGALWEYIGSS